MSSEAPKRRAKVPPRPPKIDDATWERHKDRIRFLYIDQEPPLTLKQVRETLVREEGFEATQAQYYHRITVVWKLKKRISWKDSDHIDAERKKRRAEGKETVIKVAGRVVHEDEYKPKKPRYLDTVERLRRKFAEHDSLQGYVPKGIELSTPSPLQSQSPTESHDHEIIRSEESTASIPVLSTSSYPASPTFSEDLVRWLNSANILVGANSPVPPTYSEFGAWADWLNLTNNTLLPSPSMPNSPRVSIRSRGFSPITHIPVLSTSNYPASPTFSENFGHWLNLTSPSTPNSLRLSIRGRGFSPITHEIFLPLVFQSSLRHIAPTMRFEEMFETQFSLLLNEPPSYLFANSDSDSILRVILSPEPIEDPETWATKIPRGGKGLSHFRQRQCMDLLLKSGLLREHTRTLEMILTIKESTETNSYPEPSASSEISDNPEAFKLIIINFAIELFYSAARTGDIEILKFLAHLGTLKESRDKTFDPDLVGVTAAQFAIEYQQNAATSFLLRQNINVNRAPVSELSPSLLWTAVLVSSPNLVSQLIDQGANDRRVSENSKKIDSITFARYKGKLVDDGLAWTSNHKIGGILNARTALGLSVSTHNFACFQILAEKHAQKDCHFSGNGAQEPILHLAIMRPNHLMMKNILEHPVYSGRIDEEVVEIINDEHFPHTALSEAIWNEDIETIKILLEYGADPRNVSLEHFVEFEDTGTTGADLGYLLQSKRDAFRRLECHGLSRVIGRIEELISQKKTWDTLFFDPSDEHGAEDIAIDDTEITWTYRFPKHTKEVMPTAQKVIDAMWDDDFHREPNKYFIRMCRDFLTSMELALGFFENIEIHVRAENSLRSSCITIEFLGILFNGRDTTHFISKLREAFDEKLIYGLRIFSYSKSFRNIIKYTLPTLRNCGRGDSMNFVRKMIEEYGHTPKRTINDPFVRKLDRFCFKSRRNDDGEIDYRHEYDDSKAERLLLNLKDQFDKQAQGEELQDILHWSRCVLDESLRKRLCDITVSHLSDLDPQQVACLLKLALHGDFSETVELVLDRQSSLEITTDIIWEATSFSSEKAFTRVLDHYVAGHQPTGAGLEIPLLLAIVHGQLYKIVKILPNADVNHQFGSNLTAIEVAAMLGRLDIAAVLLEAGASRNLGKAQKIAFRRGHFILQKIINQAIEARNISIDSDTESGPSESDG
ncbi:uncharacterized protein DFL_001726 [Arthrobotrys flagrans]|uniref:Clr5 domain-containing protein n=1 Tax=Arthrobotrys flagrans TaxID=97331 RepID=A0A437A8M0_ARTFL|nr:hypothetical protein DFL_001726 [Arthrobotrys flagrans]